MVKLRSYLFRIYVVLWQHFSLFSVFVPVKFEPEKATVVLRGAFTVCWKSEFGVFCSILVWHSFCVYIFRINETPFLMLSEGQGGLGYVRRQEQKAARTFTAET